MLFFSCYNKVSIIFLRLKGENDEAKEDHNRSDT